jgi:hypothetical protein
METLDNMTKRLVVSRILTRINKSQFTEISKKFIIKYINLKYRSLRDPY